MILMFLEIIDIYYGAHFLIFFFFFNVRAEVGATPTCFITWNVKGINGSNKRAKIFYQLNKLNAEIIFLQETHFKIADQVRLWKNWVEQSFHSNFNTKA